MSRLIAFALCFAMLLPAVAGAEEDIVSHLQEISVTIRSGHSSGSGILFTRKDGEQTRTFVWTASHVVDNLRKTREVVSKGNKKTLVEFEDASVVREFHQNGRRIGDSRYDARVVRYSDSEQGEDLALLEIRQRGFAPVETSVEFYDGPIPKLGSELWHVGSMLGEPNSLTAGVLSQVGRVLNLGPNGKIFDQCECTTMPGSSGGGIFLRSDGRCVGVLVRGAGEGFGLLVPVRRLREWAKEAKVEWALDHDVEMPTDKELRELPIDDSGDVGVQLSFEEGRPVEFPFLIHRTKPAGNVDIGTPGLIWIDPYPGPFSAKEGIAP